MSYTPIEDQRRWMAGAVGGGAPADEALRRFLRARAGAGRGALWARLRGRTAGLLSLADLLGGRGVRGARAGGLRSVAIAAIVASEGRAVDFDRRFRPLSGRTWDRWRDVALALEAGRALPPVELIEAGGRYAVRDGHHRISVAAALGQESVEALVTVLEV